MIIYDFRKGNWIDWILRTLSTEEVESLDPSGRWVNFQYLLLLQNFDANFFSRIVPYSMEAVRFVIGMKLGNPAQLAAFQYLITHLEADFAHPALKVSNLLFVLSSRKEWGTGALETVL